MQRAKERATNRRVRRETGELKGKANHASISVSLFVLKINKEAAKDRSTQTKGEERRENPKERKKQTKKERKKMNTMKEIEPTCSFLPLGNGCR